MSEAPKLPRSQYKFGGQRLDELSHENLLEAVESLWSSKNDEIRKLTAERDVYMNMLNGKFKVHSLWRQFADNALFVVALILIIKLVTQQ